MGLAVNAFESRIRDSPMPRAAFQAYGHAPSDVWFVGGTEPDIYAKAKQSSRSGEIPTNHNPRFAPVLHPTLEAGVAALIVASCAWLVG